MSEQRSVGGSTRRDFLKQATGASVALWGMAGAMGQAAAPAGEGETMLNYAAPAMETVRLGFVGVGARGTGHVGTALLLEGVEIAAICDKRPVVAEASAARCEERGRPRPAVYSRGEEDYRRMLESEELDAVIISTPWKVHAPMCVHTMQAGAHAFVEVPAVMTLEECWEIVEVSEKTRRHCMMMENVCYGREELMVLNMCRQGLFGDLTHGEGAYIHELRSQMREMDRGTGSWRTAHHVEVDGNLYPTHGLGPVAQYMNVNRGDRFDYLVSMSSPALGRQQYAKENFPADHIRNRETYICGDMNSSLIKTVKGRSILVQHDTTTPRPYDRLNFIQGTRGAYGGFPDRIVVEGRGDTHSWKQGEELAAFREEFEHPLWKRVGEEAVKAGGHGGMDFVMFWRMMYCLRNGEALDQDVYDAAAWSAVRPLSIESVAHRSKSVDVPDFTRGAWEKAAPLGIVS